MSKNPRKNRNIAKPFIIISCLFFVIFTSSVSAQEEIELIIHNINVDQIENSEEFLVSINLSVLDLEDRPIPGLNASAFTLYENDGLISTYTIEQKDTPLNIVLAIDTSGSMVGGGITAAKTAARRFVSLLGDDDQIAVLSFNDEINKVIDFSSDKESILSAIDNLAAVNMAGTCFYDAIHYAIQETTIMPSGTRSVVVLTDGVDETLQGLICSQYTLGEVIAYATGDETNVPIYTIGLGRQVNQDLLTEIAGSTHGNALFSQESARLDEVFELLSRQLKSEYVFSYLSKSTNAQSSIQMEVIYENLKTEIFRDLILPIDSQTVIEIREPKDGEEIGDRITIYTEILSYGEPISRVIFVANEKYIGEAFYEPYGISFLPEQIIDEKIVIEAIAFGSNNEELWRSEVTVYQPKPYQLVSNTPPPLTTPTIRVEQTLHEDSGLLAGNPLFMALMIFGFLGGGMLLVFGLFRVGVIGNRKQKNDQNINLVKPLLAEENEDVEEDLVHLISMDVKIEVIKSDQPGNIGKGFWIKKAVTTIGKSDSNDIVFIDEHEIAERHIRLEKIGRDIYVSELLSRSMTGDLIYPASGTYVNDCRLRDAEKYKLNNGDIIRLGRYFIIRIAMMENRIINKKSL
jgi:VWFA-related protein